MQKVFYAVIFSIIIFSGCTKDRTFTFPTNVAVVSYDTTKPFIVANEFVATEDANSWTNEFGKQADWIELYNPSNHIMDFNTENIYITDTIGIKDKFQLTHFTIAPKAFLMVCCDDSARNTATQIHTSFSLSKKGEFVGVYRKNNDGSFTAMTEKPFAAQTAGVSTGMYPDGSGIWYGNLTPTPGASNHQ